MNIKSNLKVASDWLLKSSQDPAKTSLTIKSTLIGLSTYALFIANVFHINLDMGQYTEMVDRLTVLFGAGLTAYHSGLAIYGAARKVITTAKGTNAVLNDVVK